MKRISLFVMAFIVSILLMGCGAGGGTENAEGTENNDANESTVNEETNGSNGTVKDDTVNDKVTPGDNGNDMEVADAAVDKITELENVESATVIVTNNNAFVAALLKDTTGGEGTDTLEIKIADEVKATDPEIKNVYVSVNPDFAERMTEYREKINAGEPVEGFFEEFTQSVQNVFPDSK